MTGLILKRASASRPSGYDVLADGVVVGRIIKAASPVGSPWMWTLAFGHHKGRSPTHGYELTREAAMAAFAKSWRRQMTKQRRLPIDQLLNYWTDVSKRPAFTLEDYVLFFERAEMTVAHFSEAYPRMSDKFFDVIKLQVWDQDRALKAATGQHRLANFAHAHMKGVAKRFIPRIKSGLPPRSSSQFTTKHRYKMRSRYSLILPN
jgi:hypothetical protein